MESDQEDDSDDLDFDEDDGIEGGEDNIMADQQLLAQMQQIVTNAIQQQLQPVLGRLDVLEAAGYYSPNLRRRLEVLDRVRLPPQIPMHAGEHQKGVEIMSEILLRIDENLPK